MKKKIYYAHSLHIYGKPQEARDVAALEKLGFEVVNPNTPEHAKGYHDVGMAHFVELVWQCNALAFRAFPGGKIPAGVAAEISEAKRKGIPVIELPNLVLNERTLDVQQTRDWLALLGER